MKQIDMVPGNSIRAELPLDSKPLLTLREAST